MHLKRASYRCFQGDCAVTHGFRYGDVTAGMGVGRVFPGGVAIMDFFEKGKSGEISKI